MKTDRRIRIAPSLLAADFSRLGAQLEAIQQGGADWLHLDVMDGHFVPNVSFGPPVIASVRATSKLHFDTHLMIEDPDRYLEAFRSAGAETITVHQEACRHLHRTLSRIRELGARAGVALNPATPVSAIADVLPSVDLILIMSVNPGFGGQSFIPSSLAKLRQARDLVSGMNEPPEIEVDGGIDMSNAAACVQAGATVLVAGTSVFRANDPAEAVRSLRRSAGEATSV